MALDWTEMQEIQKQLQKKYREQWGGLSPEKGRSQLLWMLIEAGEAADVIKKQGDDAIMAEEETRRHFVEELCDVAMYFNDIMGFLFCLYCTTTNYFFSKINGDFF